MTLGMIFLKLKSVDRTEIQVEESRWQKLTKISEEMQPSEAILYSDVASDVRRVEVTCLETQTHRTTYKRVRA